MKLVYSGMSHVLSFDGSCVSELIVENKKLFFEMVNSMVAQSNGMSGGCILSVADKPVDFSKYVDLTIQFAPFQVNRKPLLTKLYSAIEQKALLAENYMQTVELLSKIEKYIFYLTEDFPFEIGCQKLAMGSIIRALAPEIEESNKSVLEKIFSYMELVRELGRDRLFIMINMRSYFTDTDMEEFIKSVCLHNFKMLLLSNVSEAKLKNTKRYIIDSDLCEF